METLLASSEFNLWAALGILLLMGISIAGGNVVATHLFGPGRKGPVKGLVYESGMNPFTTARRRFNVRFYVVAMTFLLFDVEIVFLYPWAVTMSALQGEMGEPMRIVFLGRVLFFIFTSIIAFVYAWRKGVFRYD